MEVTLAGPHTSDMNHSPGICDLFFASARNCQDPKITKSYFVLSSHLDPEWETLHPYILTLSFLIDLADLVFYQSLWLTLSQLLLCILDHYTLASIKLLNMVVSLLGICFYILSLFMVFSMFHFFFSI